MRAWRRWLPRPSAQNAPVTVLNHPTGAHAVRDRQRRRDRPASSSTRPSTSSSARHRRRTRPHCAAGLPEAMAAGHVAAGNFNAAAAAYAKLVEARPDDARACSVVRRGAAGRSPIRHGVRRIRRSSKARSSLRGTSARRRRAPARRWADADRAVEWCLRSIPSRFPPASVQQDEALSSLHARPDFQALFKRRRRG